MTSTLIPCRRVYLSLAYFIALFAQGLQPGCSYSSPPNSLRGQRITTPVREAAAFGVFCNDLGYDATGGRIDPYAAAVAMRSLGISFVVYYSHAHGDSRYVQKDLISLDALAKVGVSVILCPFGNDDGTQWATNAVAYKQVRNLIGWYIFDEPSGRVSIKVQDSVIEAVRSIRTLPVYTSDNAWDSADFSSSISSHYDHVFFDDYFQIAESKHSRSLLPVLPALVALRDFRAVSPALGAYRPLKAETPLAAADYVERWNNHWRFFFSKQCIFFLWNNNPPYAPPTDLATIDSDPELRAAVTQFILDHRNYDKNSTPAYVGICASPQAEVQYSLANSTDALREIFNGTGTTAKVRMRTGARDFGIYFKSGDSAEIDFGSPRENIVIYAKVKDDFASGACRFAVFVRSDSLVGAWRQIGEIACDGRGADLVALSLHHQNARYIRLESTTPSTHDGFVFISRIYVAAL